MTFLALKINFVRTSLLTTLLLIFVMSCTGVEPRLLIHITESRMGEKIRYVDVISLYPYICKYGKVSVGHPRVYVGADNPLTVWIGSVLSNVRFYHLGKCTMQYFRIKATPNWCSPCVQLVPTL